MIDIDDSLIFTDDELAMLTNEYNSDPDYCSAARHLLFVYGTMKRGMRNHQRLHQDKSTKFLKPVTTVCSSLKLVMYDRGDEEIPVMVENFARNRYEHVIERNVMGELYEISGPLLSTLDLCEGHPDYYIRQKVLILNSPPNLKYAKTVWTYGGTNRFSNPIEKHECIKYHAEGVSYYDRYEESSQGTCTLCK